MQPTRVAAVTGAAGGIGRAIARRLAAENVAVAVIDIHDPSGEAVVREIQQSGGNAIYIPADITKLEQVQKAVRGVVGHFGRLDVCVNNAGGLTAPGSGSEDFLEMPIEVWENDLRLNLTAPYLMSREAIKAMLASPESDKVTINIASVNGLLAIDSPAYSAAKCALALGLTRYVATFFGAKVRALALCLGTIGTQTVLQHWLRRLGSLDALQQWYPRQRIGTPEEVAELTAFLTSEKVPFLSGSVITVDGALSAGLPHFGRPLAI